jgi:Xaa-Pro aminopeptidase
LHYTQNDAVLNDGDLLLIDAGAELHGYAADITRTFPVNGTYTSAQKDVYEVVLSAMDASIQQCRAGVPFHDIHQAALRVLCEGLHQLKICKESPDEILEKETYRRWFMHNTSHWIGRDVHDAGRYMVNGESRPLEPGMCLTVEPGLYFPAADDTIPSAFRGIGIRIEDDIHITGGEAEVLTAATVKTVADVEEACASERLAPPTLDTELLTS